MSIHYTVNLTCDYELARDCASLWEGDPGPTMAVSATKKAALKAGWRQVLDREDNHPHIKLACPACVREIEKAPDYGGTISKRKPATRTQDAQLIGSLVPNSQDAQEGSE